MKLIHLILFTLLSITVNAQQNQNDLAAEWKNGEYTWHCLKGAGTSLAFSECSKVTVEVIKNDDGSVDHIKVGKAMYISDTKGRLPHARYFMNADENSGRKLYFNGKGGIVVFGLNTSGQWWKAMACIGKAPNPKKLKNTIMSDIEAGKSILEKQEKEFGVSAAGTSIKDREVQDVKIVMIPLEGTEFVSGEDVTFGITTTMQDGQVMKTENLGGAQEYQDWSIVIEGAERTGKFHPRFGKIPTYKLKYCEEMTSKVVKLELRNTHLDIVQAKKSFDFECSSATGGKFNLIATWSQYDYVLYRGWTNDNATKKIESSMLQKEGAKRYEYNLGIMNDSRTPDDHVVVVKDNKFGVCSKSGAVLVPLKYDWIDCGFNDGLGIFKLKGKFGFIDLKDNVIVEPRYTKVERFTEGMARVTREGKVGFVNTKGNEAVSAGYDDANSTFSEGVVGVTKDGKSGYVDKTGKVVIPLKFDQVHPFLNGYAPAQSKHWGLIDKNGTPLTEFEFSSVSGFETNVAMATKVSRPGETAWIYKDGTVKWHKDPDYEEQLAAAKAEAEARESSWVDDDVITIVNDLSADQQTKYNNVRIIFDNYRVNATSIPRGGTLEVDCKDAIVVWAGGTELNNSKKVKKLFKAEGKCGQTVKLSNYW